ncbi:MAG: DUF4838 domain-containing protein [Opitutales bacterium]|nr:DUF4838 domain-containing protein [Opitutales bacterium]
MKKFAAKPFCAAVALMFAGAIFCAPAKAAPPAAGGDFCLKSCSGSKMAIVVPKDADAREQEAAQILKKYLAKALPKTGIFISSNPKDAFKYKSVSIKKNPEAKKISNGSGGDFSKAASNTVSASKKRVQIEYCASPITAAGDFLRELGFDFYAPCEIGTKVADLKTAKIKSGKKTFRPQFVSSGFYMKPTPPQTRELLLLGGQQYLFHHFSHNLKNIFNFKFAPEYLPTLKKYASKKNLQAKFNSPAAAAYAAKKAEIFFRKNPEMQSFSLGINDSLNFDISIPYDTEAPDRFISGADSISNSYYAFANQTAKKVAQTNPDKFLGLIAYLPTLRHPDFKLEKNLAPFICLDNGNSYDENFRKDREKILKAYAEDGGEFRGLYSYIYGAPYFVPRPIEEWEIEHIRLAAQLGYKAYFAEIHPIWAYDSFKLWAIQKTLRGANESFSELKTHFFANYYGAAAKDAMEFFDTAKSAWQNRADKPKWLGLYMRDTCAELFPETLLQKMEDSLKKAEAAAKTPHEKEKVAALRFEFEKTKAFCADYFAKKELFLILDKKRKPAAEEIFSAIKKSQGASANFEKTAAQNSPLYPDSPRKIRPRSFSAPIDSLLLIALKNAGKTELAEFEKLFPREKLDEILRVLNGEPKRVFAFDPAQFEGKENLENELGKKFIIKYLPADTPELKIEKCGGEYALKIANAFHCEFFKSLKLPPNRIYEINFEADFQREISSEVFLAVSVFDKNNKCALYREVSLPPLKTRENSAFKIVFATPQTAAKTTFGLYARQAYLPILIKKIEVLDFGKKD